MSITESRRTVLDRAVQELAGTRMWFGSSGHLVTGDQAASHLEAAAALMERHNWDPQLYAPLTGHHIWDALHRTRLDGTGDEDTQSIARSLLEMLLRLLTGAPYVDYESWSEHPSRTLPDVLVLLRAAADLAREHGPAAAPDTRRGRIQP
ncbi:hypothetical protein OG711_39005 (plasmid) [Streptomyces uncialis]|uniref:DUF6197 family protein n=1 Tax=Streptomyces uncialis TaxID=1048205 RepID=UPI002E30E145|nr:hypothetical protein [Streptomyces uncialis]